MINRLESTTHSPATCGRPKTRSSKKRDFGAYRKTIPNILSRYCVREVTPFAHLITLLRVRSASRSCVLGVRSRPRRGPRRAASPLGCARAHAGTRSHTHTRARAHACSHLLACLLAFASMSRSFAHLCHWTPVVLLSTYFTRTSADVSVPRLAGFSLIT